MGEKLVRLCTICVASLVGIGRRTLVRIKYHIAPAEFRDTQLQKILVMFQCQTYIYNCHIHI